MTDLLEAARVGLDVLTGELAEEQAAVRRVVREAGADIRDRRTPAIGWDVGMQLAHLAQGDELATLAITDPAALATELRRLTTGDLDANVAADMAQLRALEQPRLLEAWEMAAEQLALAVASRDATDRVAWVAGSMSLGSFVRARVMEAFAHGQDIRDALRLRPVTTHRVRHVAWLGVRTRGFSYAIRGRQAPETPVRVELDAPDGDRWTWGPDDASERIEGDAVDFALVVTRRRHPDDTSLRIKGDVAQDWMDIAQCYAGPPADQRPAGSFPDGWRDATEPGAAA